MFEKIYLVPRMVRMQLDFFYVLSIGIPIKIGFFWLKWNMKLLGNVIWGKVQTNMRVHEPYQKQSEAMSLLSLSESIV